MKRQWFKRAAPAILAALTVVVVFSNAAFADASLTFSDMQDTAPGQEIGTIIMNSATSSNVASADVYILAGSGGTDVNVTVKLDGEDFVTGANVSFDVKVDGLTHIVNLASTTANGSSFNTDLSFEVKNVSITDAPINLEIAAGDDDTPQNRATCTFILVPVAVSPRFEPSPLTFYQGAEGAAYTAKTTKLSDEAAGLLAFSGNPKLDDAGTSIAISDDIWGTNVSNVTLEGLDGDNGEVALKADPYAKSVGQPKSLDLMADELSVPGDQGAKVLGVVPGTEIAAFRVQVEQQAITPAATAVNFTVGEAASGAQEISLSISPDISGKFSSLLIAEADGTGAAGTKELTGGLTASADIAAGKIVFSGTPAAELAGKTFRIAGAVNGLPLTPAEFTAVVSSGPAPVEELRTFSLTPAVKYYTAGEVIPGGESVGVNANVALGKLTIRRQGGTDGSSAAWNGIDFAVKGTLDGISISGTPTAVGSMTFTLTGEKDGVVKSADLTVYVAEDATDTPNGAFTLVGMWDGSEAPAATLYKNEMMMLRFISNKSLTFIGLHVATPDGMPDVEFTHGAGTDGTYVKLVGAYAFGLEAYYRPKTEGKHTFKLYYSINNVLYVEKLDIDCFSRYGSGGGGGCSAAGSLPFVLPLGLFAAVRLRRR